MDEVGRKAEMHVFAVGKRNSSKYPRILLESSLKIDHFFSEKANQKKQHQILLAQAKLSTHKH